MKLNFVRVFAAVIAIECCVCGWLVYQRLARPVPAIPPTFPDDPPVAGELAWLARAAENGGAEEWLALGQKLLGLGLYGHAEAALGRAVDLAPDRVEPRFALAFALDRAGRLREAVDHYRRCAGLADDSGSQSKKPWAALAMGNALLRLGDVAAAERVFRGIVGLPPAQLQLATLLFHAGKLEESLAIVERNLPVLPLSLEWHHLRGRILGRLGRHDEAFEADMMEERGGPLVQLTFGKEYLKPFAGSRLTAALDACDRLDPVRDARLLESHLDAIAAMISGRPLPERLPLERQRARMALARQDPDRVEKILDAMESLGTIDGESLMLRAAVAEQRGDAAGAAAWGERAAAVSSAPEVQLNLASDAERAGDIAARDRHRGRGLFLEAAAVFGRNQVPTALEKLRESAALAPAEPTTWFRIGECEAMVGNRAAAEAAYRKALELRPAYGRARDRLERRVPMEGGTPGG